MLKYLKIVLASALLVPFPLVIERNTDGMLVFGVDYAFAEKGRGRGGRQGMAVTKRTLWSLAGGQAGAPSADSRMAGARTCSPQGIKNKS